MVSTLWRQGSSCGEFPKHRRSDQKRQLAASNMINSSCDLFHLLIHLPENLSTSRSIHIFLLPITKPIMPSIPRWSPIQVLTGPTLLSFQDQVRLGAFRVVWLRTAPGGLSPSIWGGRWTVVAIKAIQGTLRSRQH